MGNALDSKAERRWVGTEQVCCCGNFLMVSCITTIPMWGCHPLRTHDAAGCPALTACDYGSECSAGDGRAGADARSPRCDSEQHLLTMNRTRVHCEQSRSGGLRRRSWHPSGLNVHAISLNTHRTAQQYSQLRPVSISPSRSSFL
jgi:hypothetical protein